MEFAFVAPVTLLLIFAVIDFGRALFTYDLVANDARLGSRYAMVRGALGCASAALPDCPLTQSALQTHLQNVSSGIDISKLTVLLSHTAQPNCLQTTTVSGAASYPNQDGPQCLVTVTVNYTFNFVTLSSFASVPMTSTSQVVISQ